MFALMISWMSCSPLSYFTFKADCWIPEPPSNCLVGNPVLLQLYDEESLQCTVQTETVRQQEDAESVNGSQDNFEAIVLE